MRAPSGLGLRTLCALYLLFHTVESSNSTATDTTPKYTGWQKGPAERGTMTILWSCLTTVFACTWTILHLNIPDRRDSIWKKVLRKTKWMAITVIFPEFIFAKAVCELQMAVEDLHDLKEQEEAFGWDVEYGRVCRLLYWLFQPHVIPSSLPLPAVPASEIKKVDFAAMRAKGRNPTREWTLTHSYFANMGGIVQMRNERESYNYHDTVTAHALAKCCVPEKHDLLDHFRLTKEDILDKSKADNLLKTVAALQILWLIVSVITRKVYNLPISLLEVCTVAFAALAVATYVANWAKPKDVDVPITIISENYHGDDFYRDGKSFFARTVRPTKEHDTIHSKTRIPNDSLRLQAQGTQHLTLTYALAVSTMCFGAIHCAAWQSYFPSQVERRLWQVASVLSSTLPLTNLLALFTCNLILGKKAHKIMTTIKSFLTSPVQDSSGPTRGSDDSTIRKRVTLSWINDILCVQNENESMKISRKLDLRTVAHALLMLSNGEEMDKSPRIWCKKHLRSWHDICKFTTEVAYELVDTPEDASKFEPVSSGGQSIERSYLTEDMVPRLINAVNNSKKTTKKLYIQWCYLTKTLDCMSIILACLSGLLYVAARLILLAVAFAAFRKQNEDLYIDTWARFMPSWR